MNRSFDLKQDSRLHMHAGCQGIGIHCCLCSAVISIDNNAVALGVITKFLHTPLLLKLAHFHR